MNVRRTPFSPVPAELLELAAQLEKPIILTDYYVTRRQRIHLVHFPDDREPFTSHNLVDVLEHIDPDPADWLVLARCDLAGRCTACYIQVAPFNQ